MFIICTDFDTYLLSSLATVRNRSINFFSNIKVLKGFQYYLFAGYKEITNVHFLSVVPNNSYYIPF